MGQLTSMAFLQGGAGFHIFSSSVWNYLTGMKVNNIIVNDNEVGDPEIKAILSEVLRVYNGECTTTCSI